jgi:phage-related minor tail protein
VSREEENRELGRNVKQNKSAMLELVTQRIQLAAKGLMVLRTQCAGIINLNYDPHYDVPKTHRSP